MECTIRVKASDKIECKAHLGWEHPNCLRKHWWWAWRRTLIDPECTTVEESVW